MELLSEVERSFIQTAYAIRPELYWRGFKRLFRHDNCRLLFHFAIDKVSDMRTTFPFLFLGAGKADYYEHSSITIKFRRTVAPEEVEQLIKLVPAALYTDPFDFKGSFTSAWNDSYIQHAIQEYHGRPEDKLPTGRHELLWCSDNAIVSFEKTIIRWLMKVNAKVPIELVLRAIEPGTDGIQFSPWHHWSVRSVIPIIESWIENFPKITEAEAAEFKTLFLGIAGYVKLPEVMVRRIAERFPAK